MSRHTQEYLGHSVSSEAARVQLHPPPRARAGVCRALLESTGGLREWADLLRRPGLLLADDTGADGDRWAGVDHQTSRLRELPGRDEPAHDGADGLWDRGAGEGCG